MIQSTEETGVLLKLGLTMSEAKTYLALTQIGTSQISSLSKVTGIQRTHLYQILHSLEKKCLIEKEITPVTKYKSVPPSEALDLLVKAKKEQFSQLQTSAQIVAENLIKQAQTQLTEEKQENTQFTLVPGKQIVLNRLREMLQRSQISVNVVTTQIRFSSAIKEFFSDYKEALVRGVRIRIVTEDHLPDEEAMKIVKLLSKNPAFKVRRKLSSSPEAIVTIVDKKEACVTLSATANLKESSALWSNNNCFVAVLKNYFEDIWYRSPRVKGNKR